MYGISKGQLWVLIIGALLLWFLFLVEAFDYSSEWWGDIGSILVPIITLFYIVGWKAHCSQRELDSHLFNRKIGKIFLWLGLAVIVIPAVIGVSNYLLNEVGDDKFVGSYEQEKLDEYVGTIARLPKHAENARTCVEDKIAANKETGINSCQEKYDARYAAYLDCKEDMPWSSHYDCVTWPGANYEQVDCSEETIVAEIEEEARSTCYVTVYTEFMKAKRYEEGLVDDYTGVLPPEKSNLTQEDLDSLYSMVPVTTLNDGIKGRMNEMIEVKGYILP